MKNVKYLMLSAFAFAIASAFAFKGNDSNKANKSRGTRDVYYANHCSSTVNCSDVSGANCVTNVTTYYDVSGCSTTSAYKYLP
jgi:hypothetical protein